MDKQPTIDTLSQLYKQSLGQSPRQIEKIPAEGSNRSYFRLTDNLGKTAIGVIGTSQQENQAFLYLCNHFRKSGLPVPKIIASSPNQMCYLQTDLGRRSLFDALADGRSRMGEYSPIEIALLHKSIAILPDIQVIGARGLDFTKCYPQPTFDATNISFDLNYFKYCFLKPIGIEFNEVTLQQDFQQLTNHLLQQQYQTFMYRDFQARNIMLDNDDNPHFIDFQGGRMGPPHYDVASFLWQASAHYTPQLRNQLINTYITSLKKYIEIDTNTFKKQLNLFVLFRLLQVLGAYGFRGLYEHKQHFINSIPPAIQNLRSLLRQGICTYSYLNKILTDLTNLPQFKTQQPSTDTPPPSPLVVRVYSFSYHKGIPQDETGNGGGYVFDCRGTHNPGKYQPYKQLTGMDQPVIQFLEQDGEILTFLQSVFNLADAHITRYISRGFTNLMFAFGCTGGQHRSVYAATRLAQHINQKFGIEVHLEHREQTFKQTLAARCDKQ